MHEALCSQETPPHQAIECVPDSGSAQERPAGALVIHDMEHTFDEMSSIWDQDSSGAEVAGDVDE